MCCEVLYCKNKKKRIIIVYVEDFENGLFMVIYVPINLKIEAGFRYDNFSNVKNYSSEILKTSKHSYRGLSSTFWTKIKKMYFCRKKTYNFQLQIVIVDIRVTVNPNKDRIKTRRNKSEAEDVLWSVRPFVRRITILD